MRILSIETSCDETGIAIVETSPSENGMSITVLADTLNSQALLHAEYGGVYPSLAKREHAKNLGPLFLEALTQADMFEKASTPEVSTETLSELKDLFEREPELFVYLGTLLAQIQKPAIDAIAVTYGPGLEPALWVGVNFAKALARAWGIPIMPMNHMEGHMAAALVQEKDETHFTISAPQLPALSLLISGGHTDLILIKEWTDGNHFHDYERIGGTRDDAVGEAFDKTARLLGLPYPGGPEIAKLAQEAREEGLAQPFTLPRPMVKTEDYDFSFSGLKTAVRTLMQTIGEPTLEQKKQIAREVEDAITDVLVAKTRRAIDAYGIKSLIIGGGVSANNTIRDALEKVVHEYADIHLYKPSPTLSTDNGRMIAFAAAMNQSVTTTGVELSANGNLSLD